MGPLAEEYGFYGADAFEGTGESLAVVDTEEAWIFHILPDPTGTSAIWAAQRVPNNHFAVLANMFVIREVDPDDTDTFLMSASVHQVAQEYGWWDSSSGQLLDFTQIYSDGEYSHKFYSGRRMWGAYYLACPSCAFPANYTDLLFDPVYPISTKPDHLLSQLDLFRFHRYTYQGTPYALGAAGNLAGGPFGSPDRWKEGPAEASMEGNWERPIGLYRTSDTYVVQSNKKLTAGAILWFGPASSLGTVFTPFMVGMPDIPASFRSGHQSVFSRDSAFWASCSVHNIANLKWSYAVKDIESKQNSLEQASVDLLKELEEEFQISGDFGVVNTELLENSKHIVSSLWDLSDLILFKYASGFVNEPDNISQMVGYPKWWLEKVGYQEGPPEPPTKPRCCDPSPGHDSEARSDKVVRAVTN